MKLSEVVSETASSCTLSAMLRYNLVAIPSLFFIQCWVFFTDSEECEKWEMMNRATYNKRYQHSPGVCGVARIPVGGRSCRSSTPVKKCNGLILSSQWHFRRDSDPYSMAFWIQIRIQVLRKTTKYWDGQKLFSNHKRAVVGSVNYLHMEPPRLQLSPEFKEKKSTILTNVLWINLSI